MAVEVAQWLRGIGLEEYAPAFADNDIDGSLLPELTAEDLVALGVTSIGHRRRLLSAIAVLRGDLPQADTHGTPTISAEAERRQLSVMFCDLVGSTALLSGK